MNDFYIFVTIFFAILAVQQRLFALLLPDFVVYGRDASLIDKETENE